MLQLGGGAVVAGPQCDLETHPEDTRGGRVEPPVGLGQQPTQGGKRHARRCGETAPIKKASKEIAASYETGAEVGGAVSVRIERRPIGAEDAIGGAGEARGDNCATDAA